jgi:hypothetical protein
MAKSKRPAKRAKQEQQSVTNDVRNSRATVSGPSTSEPSRSQEGTRITHTRYQQDHRLARSLHPREEITHFDNQHSL